MTDDERAALVEQVRRIVWYGRNDTELATRNILDIIEPAIRADEREACASRARVALLTRVPVGSPDNGCRVVEAAIRAALEVKP